MNIELYNFLQKPEDVEANFALAHAYDRIGQTASAISYYLRSAEKTDDVLLQYEALIKCASCFERQGNRLYTVKGLLQRAISHMPKRPEAYFLLSRIHERANEWIECYMYSSVALEVCSFDLQPLKTDVDFPAKYAMLFQKGISAWWIGKTDESREILTDLYTNYEMIQGYIDIVKCNIDKIGLK